MRNFLLSLFLIGNTGIHVLADSVTIAFGSCYDEAIENRQIWQSINNKQPDLFLFLGDNVYVDSEDPKEFVKDYKALFANPGVAELRETSDIMATWDDHDYGINDGGKHFAAKQVAKREFISAFSYPEINAIPEEQGIYHSRTITHKGKKIRIIMLDTRWYRDDLLWNAMDSSDRYQLELGPYRPHIDQSKTLIGASQWQWLEKLFEDPVDLNIIATSIQFLAEYTAWEIWANFPHERTRLINLIAAKSPGRTVFISGDVHRGEISALPISDWQLFDITAGPLSAKTYPGKPNIHRIGGVYVQHNFGMLTITVEERDLTVLAGLYDIEGKLLEQYDIPIIGKE